MRRIEWPGCVNLRDVGGIRWQGEVETVPGRVYRSGSLVGVGDASAERLRAVLGIETYLDLRTGAEVERDGLPAALMRAGVRRLHRPIADERNPIRVCAAPGPTDYANSYLHTVTRNERELGAVLAHIATADAPLLYGCTLGKDRTGVLTMLLLLACGAPLHVVARDHALSARQLRRSLAALQPHIERKRIGEQLYRRRLEATAQAARMFVTSWLAAAGSAERAWARLGLDDAVLCALRARLVRPLAGARSEETTRATGR